VKLTLNALSQTSFEIQVFCSEVGAGATATSAAAAAGSVYNTQVAVELQHIAVITRISIFENVVKGQHLFLLQWYFDCYFKHFSQPFRGRRLPTV
jgi:hypothetical protein